MEAARERDRGEGGACAAFLLVWSLAGLSVAMFVASVPLYVLLRSAHVPSNRDVNLTVGNLLGGVLFLTSRWWASTEPDRLPMMKRPGAQSLAENGPDGEDGRSIVRAVRLVSWIALPLTVVLILGGIYLSFVPILFAAGYAVLRYRLYDIDIIINRALVYGVLTISLVLVYVGGVAGTQTAFRFLTGQDQQPQLAVVASTLAIAALFNPLRRRVQGLVDRHFYRRGNTMQRRRWNVSASGCAMRPTWTP